MERKKFALTKFQWEILPEFLLKGLQQKGMVSAYYCQTN